MGQGRKTRGLEGTGDCGGISPLQQRRGPCFRQQRNLILKSNKEIWADEYQGEGDVDLDECTAELKLDGKSLRLRE